MKTRNLIPVVFAFVLTFGLLAAPILAETHYTGNGALNGPHFTLNLLGKNWDKGDFAETDQNPVIKVDNGHRIFVKLNGKTRILLAEAPVDESFAVLDADGTDGKAKFQLPDPQCVITDNVLVSAEYMVFARFLGRPQGEATMTTGAYTDLAGNQWIMSYESVTFKQSGGTVNRDSPPKFADVTKELLTLWLDTDGDGVPDTRVGIFDDRYEGYFWDYDNNGVKHVQLRFYPVAYLGP